MARPVNSGCAVVPTKKQKMTKREDQGIGRLPDIVHLEMTTENVTKPFRDWTVLSAEHFYPEVGTKTYRVPALYFNHQNFLSLEQASKKKVSSLPSASCPSFSSSSCSSFSSSSCSSSSSSFSCPSFSSPSCPSYSSPSCPSSSSPPSPSTSSSTASSATFPSPSEVKGYEDLNANHVLGYADSCKSAASRRGELLQNNAEFAEKNLAPRLPDREGRAGLEPSHPFKVCTRAHDNVGNVVGSGGGFLAASPLSHRPPSSLSDCTISGLLNDACSESLKREFCVSAEESKNLTHDAECNAQKVSCFESVDDEDDDKHKHLSESIVSLAAFKSKMKRRRRTLPKIEEALDKMQNSDNFEDDDQRKVQKTPFSSQEELSMCLEDGSTHRKDPHRILHPAGDENTPERCSSASNMLADNQSSTEETQKLNTASQTPASKSKSTHVQPVQLIYPPQESMVRRDKAMTVVLDSFETLGKELEQEGRKGLFILSGVNYDNYLNRIPVQVLRECDGGYLGDSHGCRGVLDILILHEHVGMMLVQVKSVGGNKAEWRASDSEMVTVLKKVIKKVKAKSQKVTDNLSKELILDSSREKQEAAFLTTIHVLALPFIPRRLYHKTLEDDSTADQFHDCFELKVLCKEDFEFSASLGRAMKTSVGSATFQTRPPWLLHAHGCGLPSSAKSPLFLWWTSTLVDTQTRLSQDKIKEIVGRLCGIFSSMTAVPDAKYRKEVRTFGHCVSETAARYGAPCLTTGQYDVLQCPHRFVALSGPPGSGKSLMLTLKAVQWLEQGDHSEDHVVVASIGRTVVTPAHVRVLQENINQRRTGTGSGGHLLRVLYPLNKIPPENIEQEVAASVASLMTRVREAGAVTKGEAADVPEDKNRPTANSRTRTTDRLHFVLSDVEPEDEKTQRVLRALSQHPFVHSVWWSTSEPPRSQGAWPLFRVEELRDVTRRSPHVQRVLKRLEPRERWKDLYVSSSVESGLPTEGPSVVYIQHQRHLQELRQASSGSVHTRMERQNQHPEQHQIHRRWEIQRYLNGVGHEHHSNGVGEHDPTLDNAKLFHLQQDQPGLGRREIRSRDPHHISHSRQLTLNSDRSSERVKGQDMLQDLLHPITETQSMPSEEWEVEGFASRTADDNSNSVLQQVGGNVDGDLHSPFWCDMCAEEVAGIVSYLITDSAIANLSPFFIGETKFLKDPSKNKFGMPIKPRDILILTNFPRQKNGIRTSQEEEEEDEEVKRGLKDYIMHSTLVQRLRKEVQLKVLTEASAGKIAFPRNSVVLTDARSARGLERKVVIYVPSGLQSIRCESGVSDNATETDPRAAFDEEPRLCSISGSSLGRKTHPLPMRGRLDTSEDVILDMMNVPTETPWVEKSSVDPLIINASKQAGGLMFSGNRQDGSVDHTALDGQTEERSTSFVALNAGKLSDDDRSHLDSWFDVCNASDLEEDDESCMDTSSYSMDSYGETTSEPTSNDFTTDTLEYPEYPEVVLTPTSREIASEYDGADAEYYEQVDNIHLPTSHTCRTSNRQDQIPASLATTTNGRLPCWLKDNKRTNRTKNPKLKTPEGLQQRHKQQRIELAEVLEEEEADGVVKEGEKTDSSGPCDNLLDNLLSGLSDDSRAGLYVAAASCLAQLVVVIPEHL